MTVVVAGDAVGEVGGEETGTIVGGGVGGGGSGGTFSTQKPSGVSIKSRVVHQKEPVLAKRAVGSSEKA